MLPTEKVMEDEKRGASFIKLPTTETNEQESKRSISRYVAAKSLVLFEI